MSRESFKITHVDGWKILDSRGSETVEVELGSGEVRARASAPAGKSRGSREAIPFPSKGVSESIMILRSILAEKLRGMDPSDQKGVDAVLKQVDGAELFSRIGGNLAYAVSACAAALAAKLKKIPIWLHISQLSGLKPFYPIPLGNVLGGGAHAGEGTPDIQEYLVFPSKPKNVEEAVMTNVEIHRRLGKILSQKVGGFGGGKGDEGAYAPPVDDQRALELVQEAVSGFPVMLGLDVAASSLYDSEMKAYVYRKRGKKLTRDQHMQQLFTLVEKYAVKYVEDPFDESDFDGFVEMCRRFPNVLVCGDDLVVTRVELIRKAADMGAIRAVILKPNQVGTISDTVEAAVEAERKGILRVVSHRSGETCDGFIAHLAVGLGSKFIKAGVMGGERVAKANELLRISYEAGDSLPMQEVKLG